MVTLPILSCFLMNILFFYGLSMSTIAAVADVDLLISFKNSLLHPDLLSNWNHSLGVCEFQGVACNKGGLVSSLTLRGLPLGANFSSVSAYILPLQNLETLTLSSTNLTGNISSSNLNRCASRLTVLNLSSNKLVGAVSDVVSLATSCSSLQSLDLSNNYIGQRFNTSSSVSLALKMLNLSHNMIVANGDLQLLFSTLSFLMHLDLSNNKIQGTIPHITNSTVLQYLDMSSNELSGTVPTGTFMSCTELSYLNLSSNNFTGKVPPDLNACRGLTTISLSNNNFSGEITILPRLQFLELAFNNFDDHIPNSISELTILESLDLSANKLSGSIPGSLCSYNVSNLKELYLQDNYFSGTIPDSLSNCTNLVSLDLSLNFLSGSIPSSLGSLSNLRDLLMWENDLHGEIPTALSSLRSPRKLVLDYNDLTGMVPDGLVNCTSLNWISLASNYLTGSIPIWIGKLEKLEKFVLRNNSFSGSIPPKLGDIVGLQYLDLSSNKLSGSIPPTLAKQSGKKNGDFMLKGWPYYSNTIDDDGRCHIMTILLDFKGIRYNDLMRNPTIRYCNSRYHIARVGQMGEYLTNCVAMVFLDLSYNHLDGHIPTEFSTMQFMIVLYLEHNHESSNGTTATRIGAHEKLNTS